MYVYPILVLSTGMHYFNINLSKLFFCFQVVIYFYGTVSILLYNFYAVIVIGLPNFCEVKYILIIKKVTAIF